MVPRSILALTEVKHERFICHGGTNTRLAKKLISRYRMSAESPRTYSPSDRWRVLSLQSCSGATARYTTWEMIPL